MSRSEEEIRPPAIEVRGICKSFGPDVVLADVSFSVSTGDVVAVLGPSGSGKSTLCRVVVGLELPDQGEVLLGGKTWTCVHPESGKLLVHRDYRAMRLQLGMVFQDYTLFPHMSVLNNVALGPRRVLRMRRSDAVALAEKALEQVGILGKANMRPSQLSGGQKQRVAIARELAMGRETLVFDEATSALDPELTAEVQDTIKELAESGLTMLVVTHEMGFARRASTRTVFMDQGHIVEQGTTADFFESPQTLRAAKFLHQLGKVG